MQIEALCEQVHIGPLVSAEPIGDGHINDTFLTRTQTGTYVCQRVRQAMDPAKLLHNYRLYAKACEAHDWLYPKWLSDDAGNLLTPGEDGCSWRVYPFLQGDILQAPLAEAQLLACGKGLAKMHRILQSLPEKPKAVYPILHDLAAYDRQYRELLQSGEAIPDNRDPMLEEIIEKRIPEYLSFRPDRSTVVHGDAKLANILFREGAVAGFLDFDTVMQGALSEDVADCIRSCCITDGKPDREAARILTQGYLRETDPRTAEQVEREIPEAFRKICFELGLRYYTDAISKNRKFKEHFPGYRLEKARRLLLMEF